MSISSHSPSKKNQITVRFRGHFRTVGVQPCCVQNLEVAPPMLEHFWTPLPVYAIINWKPAIITATVYLHHVKIHYNCDIWLLNTCVSSVIHYIRRISSPSEKGVTLRRKR